MHKAPFIPQTLPIKGLNVSSFLTILGEANRNLSRYDGVIRSMINPEILLSPFITQEAVLSSKIEGTQATLDEIYEKEAGESFSQDKEADIQEIQNYRKAMMFGSLSLNDRSLSLFLIKEIHKLLLDGVRGNTKTPGMFRTEQNWIGKQGCAMDDATYIPPDPLTVEAHLDNWLSYILSDDLDPIIQTAIMHAQFEIIHPFLDGNGRIGRLLIPLLLFSKKILCKPLFYLSGYLEKNRDEYYSRLNEIHTEEKWDNWIFFFCHAVRSQSEENLLMALEVNKLHSMLSQKFRKVTNSTFHLLILNELFRSPIFTKSQIATRIKDCNEGTVKRIIDTLAEKNLIDLVKPGKGRRPDRFQLSSLLKVASGIPVSEIF